MAETIPATDTTEIVETVTEAVPETPVETVTEAAPTEIVETVTETVTETPGDPEKPSA